MVSARRGMLQRCLNDITAAPLALSSHPDLLQFLGAPVPETGPPITSSTDLVLSQHSNAAAAAAVAALR